MIPSLKNKGLLTHNSCAVIPQTVRIRFASAVSFIASIPLTTRFNKTCWSWTRSAITGGKSSAKSVRIATCCAADSYRARADTSATTSLKFSRAFANGSFLTNCRTRPTTALARSASSIISASALRISWRWGTESGKKLRQALALLRTAVRGWLTSCAIDAVNSPMLVTLAACVSSDRTLPRASSASWRCVTS